MGVIYVLRNSIPDPANRKGVQEESFIADAGNNVFDLDTTNLKSIMYVKVDGEEKRFKDKYLPNFDDNNVEVYGLEDGDVVTIKYVCDYSFIYPGYRLSSNLETPQITVLQDGPSQIDVSIGGARKHYEILVQIDIWVDINDSFVINSDDFDDFDIGYEIDDEVFNGSKLRDFLADQVIRTVDKKRGWIPNIVSMRVAGARDVEGNVEDMGVTRKTIDVEVIYSICN